MNKVKERSLKNSTAKFHYAAQKMFFEAKLYKITLYIVSMIPIILSFVPAINSVPNLTFGLTMGTFLLNIIAELAGSLINSHKEKGVLLSQLFEVEVTGSSFSKIEYDRELTNELNELAIRKAMGKMQKKKTWYCPKVPDDIADEYSYLYLSRTNSASIKYILSRMFYFYIIVLCLIVALFSGLAIIKNETKEFLQLIIQFYPLVIPVIRNINACNKAMKYCSKIDADIDNFFADGDDSLSRLARFQYYVQNIEFEMLMACPARYKIFPFLFKRGIKTLTMGVTQRFIEAIEELKKKALMNKGITIRTPKKDIVTKTEIPLEKLEKKEKKLLKQNEVKPDPTPQQQKKIVKTPLNRGTQTKPTGRTPAGKKRPTK